jgi:hypothetical protein
MKRILFATAIFILSVAGSLIAQDTRIPLETRCPFPTTLTIAGGTVAAPVIAEFPANTQAAIVGSAWNQAAANKAFGHTFRFPVRPRECCVITKGTLVVNVRALQDATSGGADAGNDGANLYSGGALVTGQTIWTPPVNAGQTKSLTFNLTAGALATGLLSIYVQDDTAVVSAQLVVEYCCLTGPCVETTLDLRTGSSNGSAIPIGTTDSHWTVQPPGGPVAPAVAINRGATSWIVPPPGTQWISSSPTATALGQYVYKFNFNLGAEGPGRSCRIALEYAVDNDMTMQLDNAPPFASTAALTNPFTHFNALHGASTPIVPASGPHVLTVNVANTSGPTGLLVTGKIICTCKGGPAGADPTR